MKPIAIYTMPRTKGTAALSAANRNLKLNEPIEIFELAKITNTNEFNFFETRAVNQSNDSFHFLQKQMSHPDTASKFFGSGLQQFYPARKWFHEIDTANSHDLYVLIRNPIEVLWSFVIALHYGFNLSTETVAGDIQITDTDIYKADLMLDNFLRFYPKNGKLVTFDTLPIENFNYASITMGKQHSINKKQFVVNKDYVDKNIELILNFYRQEWEDKTGTDIFTFQLTV